MTLAKVYKYGTHAYSEEHPRDHRVGAWSEVLRLLLQHQEDLSTFWRKVNQFYIFKKNSLLHPLSCRVLCAYVHFIQSDTYNQ